MLPLLHCLDAQKVVRDIAAAAVAAAALLLLLLLPPCNLARL